MGSKSLVAVFLEFLVYNFVFYKPAIFVSTLQLQKIFPYVGMWLTEGLSTFFPHLAPPA